MFFKYLPIFSAVLMTLPLSAYAAKASLILTNGETNQPEVNIEGAYDIGVYATGVQHSINSEKITINLKQLESTQPNGFDVVRSKDTDTIVNLGKEGHTKTISINVTDTTSNPDNLVLGLSVQNTVENLKNKVELNVASESLIIKAESKKGWVYGITSQSGTTPANNAQAFATLNIKSKNIYVDAISGVAENASALVAFSEGRLNIDGNLFVNTNGGNGKAISTRGGAEININQSGNNTVVLNGDISFDFYAPNSATPVDATLNLNLTGAESSWTGNTIVSWEGEPTPEDVILKVEGMKLSLSDGAVWTPTVTENDKTTDRVGSKYTKLNALKLGGGVINVTSEDIDVTVEKVTGTGTINLATDGTTAGKFNVEAAEKASLSVNLMDTKLEKQLTADEINADQAKKLMANVGANADGENVVSTSTAVPEGMVNPAFGVDAEGKTHTASANTLMQSSLELASAAPLALNRIMMNDVRKRLGDIRTTEGTHGAWARYDGGKLSGEGGLENDFHTVQVGIDTVPTADSARMGVAFSYTDSDAEYARGSADMKAYSIAMYGTKVFDNGMFVDVIGRMGTADSDLTVDGQHKGTLDNVVLGVSGEFGWRFDVTNSMYIEPQAELSYAYVNGDKLTLGTAEYDVDSVNSLLGRVGFAAGLKCPSDMGNVYVRASAVHEFLGDSKITGANAGHTNVYEIDGKDTWVEYGLGANFNVTKSTYMWADVERTSGGALDEDWRATVGVRYAW